MGALKKIIFFSTVLIIIMGLINIPANLYGLDDGGGGGGYTPPSGGSSGGSSGGGSGGDSGGNEREHPDPPSSGGGNTGSSGGSNGSGDGSGGGSGSSGGTENPGGEDPYDSPSEPSPEEVARAMAEGLDRLSREMGVSLNEIDKALKEEAIRNAIESLGKTSEKSNTEKNTATPGDPVLATTGGYLLEVEDFPVSGSAFTVRRKYLSEEKITGSMGAGWLVSLDSRIVRGVTRVDEAKLNEIKGMAVKILENYEKIDKYYAADIAEKVFTESYLPAKKKLDELLAIKTRGEKLAALNIYSLFRGTPEYYEGVGNESLTLIDEDGIAGTFEPAGTGTWIPANYPERLYERLESLDGNGAESLAGYVLSVKGGIKKHYDGYGMLIGVSALNGKHVDLERDSKKQISRIRASNGNEWLVSYSGDFIGKIISPDGTDLNYGYIRDELARVRDFDGDTVSYGYEEGRLKEIVKPDGSAININYGLISANGKLLVTSTSHEEGDRESFDYDQAQRITTYKNHSGVITRYLYDEKHRTVREEHSDGSLKTFAYNSVGLLERETFNGFETRYDYDGRGNTTEKIFGDGSRQRWEWNENDQVTRYIDRDGVVSEWKYDNRWNCIELKKGGQVILSASYDSKNRAVTYREGDRAEQRYEYDSHDYISARTVTIQGREIREKWENDVFGRVLKYSDGAGRVWEYKYSAKETTEIMPSGLERRYEYNNRKDLVRVTEKDTRTGEEREILYRYDKRHLPIETADGAGNITKYYYRPDGELIRMEQGAWFRDFGYEAGGRRSTVTSGKTGSGKNYTESYTYAWQGRNEERTVKKPGAGTTGYNIDPWDRVTAVTNALGEKSIRTLNGEGNPIREQGLSGGFYEYRYDSLGRPYEAGREGERAAQVRYNRDGSLAEKTDRLGNVTRYVYDGRGLPEREISSIGEKRFFYDDAGRVIRWEAANRNGGAYRTEYQYNDSQRIVTIISGGIYTETLYLNAWEEVTRRLDGEGNENRYEYDGSGRLVKSMDAYGRGTNYTWNDIGKLSTITYADGTTEHFDYDHLGNLTETKDAFGVSWAGEYDEAGRLAKETGRPGINREYKYDVLGRIVELYSGGEIAEKYRYSNRGRETVFTDGAGRDFIQRKNTFGEMTDETNRLGDSSAFMYDLEGRLTASTAYSGKEKKTEYRDAEGISLTTYAEGTKIIIERDILGNIVRAENDTGLIQYKYDSGGKFIEQIDQGAWEVTRYTYDKAGRRIRMQSGNRDVQYRYGRNGELLLVSDLIQRLELSYEYDVRGRETRRIYGNGVKQETLYDTIGRVILIRETDSLNRLLRAEGYLYDALGRRTHSVNEEGFVTKYEYDRQSRLSSALYPWTNEKAEADRKEAEEAGLFFTLNKGNGERYTFTAAEQSALRDILNKAAPMRANAINSSQLIWRESYTYDKNGNRSNKTTPWGTINYEYDKENRLVRKGDIEYIIDKDGNTLEEKGLRYEASYRYNGLNRMVYSEVSSHAEKTQTASFYAYDALGRRTITESITGQTLRTLYDGKGFELIREGETFRDGSFTTRYAPEGSFSNSVGMSIANQATGERYRWIGDSDSARTRSAGSYTVQESRFGGRGVTLYGNGEAVAMTYCTSTSSRSMYLGKDVMGSVRSVTVETGALENRYEYDAFGEPYKGELDGGMNLGYTGKPFDTATGLYNYGYRDYKPQTARFTTSDPIRDGNNWFAYVNNDPVNWVDLWGLDMMYSTYVQDSGKITSTYIPTNSNGSIDYTSIKVYSFNASNDVSTKLNTTIPVTGSPEYYYPQSFPSGTWDIGNSRSVPDSHINKLALGDVFVPTTATQIVDTYGTTKPSTGDLPTNTQVDQGYGLHYSNYNTTAGCIKIGSQEEANKFASLSDQAITSKNGKSSISVMDAIKKNK